jgi:proline iminopeptidase
VSRVRAVPAALGLLAGAYALAVRPRLLRWGATDEEVRHPFPGADVIAGGRRGATMAATIDAPPAQVWPWLAQMGCDRGGWYSWDRLDNGGAPSAERIHPEWQDVALGDRFASTPDGRAWFEVAALEPGRFLGLRAPLDLRGRPFDTGGPRPRFYSDSIWSFLLEELPGGRTRLIVSGYAAYRPRMLLTLGNIVFWEPAHAIMQTRQFANLKRRAEHARSHADAEREQVVA